MIGDIYRKITQKLLAQRAVCMICGAKTAFDSQTPSREVVVCSACGSTGRSSAIVYELCRLVYGNTRPLCDQPDKKDTRIIGLSDWEVYANPLAGKFDYTNTHFHKEPFLDIRNPPSAWADGFDVLISSDVFEHVVGSSIAAFEGAFFLLRPGGHIVLSVPYVIQEPSKEHYPDLQSYDVRKLDGERLAVDLTYADGRREIDENAIFHGGDGATLEVRVFSRSRIAEEMAQVGFIDICFHDENRPEVGIQWQPWSRIVTARKPDNGSRR